MAKFNSKSVGIKTINKAGGKAYSLKPELELATLALTSFNENKFYESASDQNKRLVSLVESADKDFVGKLAVVARKEFNMRSVSHVLVAELARLHKGQKHYIKSAFQRPDDLNEIVAYYGNKYGKPIPNSIKKAVREILPTLNAYQLGKYKCESRDVKLVDLFNLTHPKPKDDVQAKMWTDLMKGDLQSPETWEVLISTAKDDAERTKAWERLIVEGKLGYMAMLRNLRNFDKYKISKEARLKVVEYLTNIENVKRSKQLPFRFFSAYQEAPTTQFKDAVSVACDLAIDNMPELDGKTAILIDVSGSMTSNLSSKTSVSYVDIARLFGVALWKKNPHTADIYGFDHQVYGYNLSSRTPLIDLINQINANGGSTDLWKVFAVFKEKQFKYDRIVVFSDMQAWDSGYHSQNVQANFDAWAKDQGIKPFVYSVDLAGNGSSQFGKINMIAGWSEKIFDLMKVMEQDSNALVNMIKNYEV